MRENETHYRFFHVSFSRSRRGLALKPCGEASDLLTHEQVQNPTKNARNESKRHAKDQREKSIANCHVVSAFFSSSFVSSRAKLSLVSSNGLLSILEYVSV